MTSELSTSLDDAAVEQAASLIRQADALIIAAGAGMGVDSGLPDFRGQDGFWRDYPALAKARIDFHRIASPAAFNALHDTHLFQPRCGRVPLLTNLG